MYHIPLNLIQSDYERAFLQKGIRPPASRLDLHHKHLRHTHLDEIQPHEAAFVAAGHTDRHSSLQALRRWVRAAAASIAVTTRWRRSRPAQEHASAATNTGE